jgi:hypothetical protein
MWCRVIWQIDTNVAQEIDAPIYSSQNQAKYFPWHFLLQNVSYLFSFLKLLFLPTFSSKAFFLIPFILSPQPVSWLTYRPWFLS